MYSISINQSWDLIALTQTPLVWEPLALGLPYSFCYFQLLLLSCSALWPFSTLGWPDLSEDYKHFYPSTLLETGYVSFGNSLIYLFFFQWINLVPSFCSLHWCLTLSFTAMTFCSSGLHEWSWWELSLQDQYHFLMSIFMVLSGTLRWDEAQCMFCCFQGPIIKANLFLWCKRNMIKLLNQ
jgi:hypothetical protein